MPQTYANAKRILKNSEARISQSPEGIFDENAVVLFWDNIEARYINECINYLNDLNEQPVLAGPTQFYDTLFEEPLYHLHAYYAEDADRPDPNSRQQRIYRIMMRNPVSYSADNWGETSTRWKLENGNTATGGPSSLLTLSMANVTVEAALAFELQALADEYTDEIYLLRGILLQGVWHSIRRRSEVSPKTGLYTLYWFLSNGNAKKLYAKAQAGPNTIKGVYHWFDATEADVAELMGNTFFTAQGEIDPDGAITDNPRTSWNLSETVAGREVVERLSVRRDPEDLLFDVDIQITWRTDTQFTGATAITISNGATVSVFEVGFRATEAQVNAKRVAYASLTTGQTGKFDVKEGAGGLWEYTGVIVTKNAISDYVVLADQTAYYGSNINPASGATCNFNGTLQTWTAFKASLGSAMGNARVDFNDDGTLNYIVTTTGTLTDSDWTFYNGDTVTERLIVLRNKTDAEVDTALGTTYVAALAAAAGKVVAIERIKDDALRMTVTIHITTAAAKTIATTTVSSGGGRESVVTEQGWSVSQATAEALDAGYASLAVGTTGKIDIKRNADGTYDYVGVKSTISYRSYTLALADQKIYVGANINTATGTPCDHNGVAKSWTDFKTAVAGESGTGRIDQNADGTINYVVTTTGALTDSDWTFYRGDTVTERLIVLRSKTDAEIDTALGTTYVTALAAAAGKIVSIERIKDEALRMTVTIHITTATAKTLATTTVSAGGGRESVVTEQGWSVTQATAEALDAGYGSLAVGTTGKIDIKRNEDGSYDYVGVKSTISSRSYTLALADQTIYVGANINTASGTPCDHNGVAKSWTDFKTAVAGESGTGRIEQHNDGTITYIVTTTGALALSDWTYYVGDTITERIIVLRNKTDAEIDTAIGTTYVAALAAAAGKRVVMERIKDDAQKISLTIRITTAAAKVIATTTVSGARNSVVTEQGWSVTQAAAEALDAGYGSLGAGVQGKIEIKRNEDGSYDYVGVKTTLSATSDFVVLADQTAYYGSNIDPASGATCNFNGTLQTWTAFKASLGAAIGNARIDFNEDGTLNYVAVTESHIERFYKDSDTAVAVPNTLLVAKGTSGTLVDVCRFGHYMKETWVQHGVRTDSLPTFTAFSYSTDGLSSIRTKLAGPNGAGEVQIHEDGKYSWTLITEKVVVANTNWHIFGIEHDTKRFQTRQSTNFQQIRRRVGGDFAFNVDPATGAYTGVPWDNDFDLNAAGTNGGRVYGDTFAPTAWVTKGYFARYGAWDPDWEKSFTPSGIGTAGHQYRSMTSTSTDTFIVSVGWVYFCTDLNVFRVCHTGSGAAAVALSSNSYFNSVTPANIHKVSGGCPGLPGKIGLRGVANVTKSPATSYPENQPDWYIRIKQELSRTVAWDDDFDTDHPYGSTVTPAAWASKGYDLTYGPWVPGWEKSFIVGGIGTEGHKYVGTVANTATTISYALSALKRVWFCLSNNTFYWIDTVWGSGTKTVLDTNFTAVTPANIHKTSANGGCPGLPGYIAIRGVGTYPTETPAEVGVLGGDGGYAFSLASRVRFYSSPIENPRMSEIFDCQKQEIQTITLYTYFAVNPHWLAANQRRIPASWASLADIKTEASSVTAGVLPIAYNADNSNFGIQHRLVSIGDDIFAFEKKIELRSELVTDTAALQAIIAKSGADPANCGISGCKAVVYTDLTRVAAPSWLETFKEVG